MPSGPAHDDADGPNNADGYDAHDDGPHHGNALVVGCYHHQLPWAGLPSPHTERACTCPGPVTCTSD